MPRISEFFGIAIYMYYKDHLPSHFHAIYAEYDAAVGIDPIQVLEGRLSRRAESLVYEWAAKYQAELRVNWELARAGQPLQPIPPLD
jgi:hypothetical protein